MTQININEVYQKVAKNLEHARAAISETKQAQQYLLYCIDKKDLSAGELIDRFQQFVKYCWFYAVWLNTNLQGVYPNNENEATIYELPVIFRDIFGDLIDCRKDREMSHEQVLIYSANALDHFVRMHCKEGIPFSNPALDLLDWTNTDKCYRDLLKNLAERVKAVSIAIVDSTHYTISIEKSTEFSRSIEHFIRAFSESKDAKLQLTFCMDSRKSKRIIRSIVCSDINVEEQKWFWSEKKIFRANDYLDWCNLPAATSSSVETKTTSKKKARFRLEDTPRRTPEPAKLSAETPNDVTTGESSASLGMNKARFRLEDTPSRTPEPAKLSTETPNDVTTGESSASRGMNEDLKYEQDEFERLITTSHAQTPVNNFLPTTSASNERDVYMQTPENNRGRLHYKLVCEEEQDEEAPFEVLEVPKTAKQKFTSACKKFTDMELKAEIFVNNEMNEFLSFLKKDEDADEDVDVMQIFEEGRNQCIHRASQYNEVKHNTAHKTGDICFRKIVRVIIFHLIAQIHYFDQEFEKRFKENQDPYNQGSLILQAFSELKVREMYPNSFQLGNLFNFCYLTDKRYTGKTRGLKKDAEATVAIGLALFGRSYYEGKFDLNVKNIQTDISYLKKLSSWDQSSDILVSSSTSGTKKKKRTRAENEAEDLPELQNEDLPELQNEDLPEQTIEEATEVGKRGKLVDAFVLFATHSLHESSLNLQPPRAVAKGFMKQVSSADVSTLMKFLKSISTMDKADDFILHELRFSLQLKAEETLDVIPASGLCAMLAPYLAAKRYDSQCHAKPASTQEANNFLPKTTDEKRHFFETVLNELSKGEDVKTRAFLDKVGMGDIPAKWKSYQAILADYLEKKSSSAFEDFSLPKECWGSEAIAVSLFVLDQRIVPLNLFVMNNRFEADESSSTSLCTLNHLMYYGQTKPSGEWYTLYDILNAANHNNNVVLQSSHFYFLRWPIDVSEKLEEFIKTLQDRFNTFRVGIQNASEEELAEATNEIIEWCRTQYSSVSLSSTSSASAAADCTSEYVINLGEDFKEIGMRKPSSTSSNEDKSIITVEVKATRRIVNAFKNLKSRGKPTTRNEIDEMWAIIEQLDLYWNDD